MKTDFKLYFMEIDFDSKYFEEKIQYFIADAFSLQTLPKLNFIKKNDEIHGDWRKFMMMNIIYNFALIIKQFNKFESFLSKNKYKFVEHKKLRQSILTPLNSCINNFKTTKLMIHELIELKDTENTLYIDQQYKKYKNFINEKKYIPSCFLDISFYEMSDDTTSDINLILNEIINSSERIKDELTTSLSIWDGYYERSETHNN
jgi:hypothetical protein